MANDMAIVQEFKKGNSLSQIMLTHHLTMEVLRKKLAYFKGKKNGLCNRGACQTEKYVVFYNKSTQLFYCVGCAVLINNACFQPDLDRLYGKGMKFLCATEEGLGPYEFERREFQREVLE